MSLRNRILLVEGNDDQHVLWALLARHDFPETFTIKSENGVENLLSTLPVQLKASNIECVGVLIDADYNEAARWASMRIRLIEGGYINVPNEVPAEGLVIETEDLPRAGVWIMPDNTTAGMLEDFVFRLIPDGDAILSHVDEALSRLPVKRFTENQLPKARIHTWLAWQEDPGTPMGLAITKRYLSHDTQEALSLIAWLQRLFC